MLPGVQDGALRGDVGAAIGGDHEGRRGDGAFCTLTTSIPAVMECSFAVTLGQRNKQRAPLRVASCKCRRICPYLKTASSIKNTNKPKGF